MTDYIIIAGIIMLGVMVSLMLSAAYAVALASDALIVRHARWLDGERES